MQDLLKVGDYLTRMQKFSVPMTLNVESSELKSNQGHHKVIASTCQGTLGD